MALVNGPRYFRTMSSEDLYTFAKATCTSCSQDGISRSISASQSTTIKCNNCGKVIVKISRFEGVVYILKNPSFDGLLKIGFTPNRLEERIAGLDETNMPTPFECVAAFHSYNPRGDERRIHERLQSYRHNKNREFFRISPSRAVSICHDIIGRPPYRTTIQPKVVIEGRENDKSIFPTQPILPVDSTKLLKQRREHIGLVAIVVALAIMIKCC